MRTIGAGCIIVLLLCSGTTQGRDHPNSVSLFGTYSSESKLFHHPDDADPSFRGQFLPIDNIVSGGIDYRRAIDALRFQFIFSIEYLTANTSIALPLGDGVVDGMDGYSVIPVELSGSFDVPVGSDAIQFYVGGGGGMYLGQRNYDIGGISSEIVSRKPGFGIQILSGVELALWQGISVRSEVKFRNIQFESTNRFPVASVRAGAGSFNLDNTPFDSRISIEGTTFHFGIAYRF